MGKTVRERANEVAIARPDFHADLRKPAQKLS
jgi:acyl-CoA hydrolase